MKWDKVFKNGTSKICGRKPLENLGCLPQVLLGPFLNTLSQIIGFSGSFIYVLNGYYLMKFRKTRTKKQNLEFRQNSEKEDQAFSDRHWIDILKENNTSCFCSPKNSKMVQCFILWIPKYLKNSRKHNLTQFWSMFSFYTP